MNKNSALHEIARVMRNNKLTLAEVTDFVTKWPRLCSKLECNKIARRQCNCGSKYCEEHSHQLGGCATKRLHR